MVEWFGRFLFQFRGRNKPFACSWTLCCQWFPVCLWLYGSHLCDWTGCENLGLNFMLTYLCSVEAQLSARMIQVTSYSSVGQGCSGNFE